MGVDFLEKVKKPFRQHLDRQRAKLLTEDLFTVEPTLEGRVLKATPKQIGCSRVGDHVTIESENGALLVRSGVNTVAELDHPPSSICRNIQQSGLILSGVISSVNAFSGTLGVKIIE